MKTPTSSPPELALLPLILTAVLVGLAGVLSALFSWPVVALCLGACPVALVLLWMTRDVPAPADRIAAVDREHAERRQWREGPVRAEAPPIARAA